MSHGVNGEIEEGVGVLDEAVELAEDLEAHLSVELIPRHQGFGDDQRWDARRSEVRQCPHLGVNGSWQDCRWVVRQFSCVTGLGEDARQQRGPDETFQCA